MKFSILIAFYNNWNYFEQCYQSIINQSYTNYEIVIVDDYSTDGSFGKLEELAKNDSRIKLFRNSENKKVGYTKRRCVNAATGEICGFLDPDDKLSVNALNEVVNIYAKNKQVVATYSKIKLINSESKEIGVFKYTKKIINNNKLFFNINFEVAHFFTFKKEVYKKTVGINSSLIISEDQDLYFKMYEQGNFYYINSYQYFYRIHENGISQNKNKTEKQKNNWHTVIYDACKRRNITKLYKKNIDTINYLPEFLYHKENTLFKRILRKISKKFLC